MHLFFFRTIFLVLVLLTTLSACVSTTDYDRLRNQVYHQQERITQLESNLAQSQPAQAQSWADLNTVRSQLATLSGQVDDLQHIHQSQQSAAGGLVTVDSLNTKVQELDRRTLFMATQLGIVLDEMPAAPKPEETTPWLPPTTAMTSPTLPPAIEEPAPAPMAPPASSTEQPGQTGPGENLYQQALESFYAQKYQQAQTMWAEFVKGYPQDALVPNAIFWQGESFFQMQDYANAALTYQQVIEKYPKSNKYKAALLKQGISFFKLKKDQAGKLVLQDLIKKYPDSAEAKRAQAYLKSGN